MSVRTGSKLPSEGGIKKHMYSLKSGKSGSKIGIKPASKAPSGAKSSGT